MNVINNEIDMLKGNINRILIYNDVNEIKNMSECAHKRI